MTANEIRRGTTIVNVVNLDIRTATEAAVAAIDRIINVVNLIHSPETAYLVARLNIVNIVNTIEAPQDASVYHDRLVLDHAMLASRTAHADS